MFYLARSNVPCSHTVSMANRHDVTIRDVFGQPRRAYSVQWKVPCARPESSKELLGALVGNDNISSDCDPWAIQQPKRMAGKPSVLAYASTPEARDAQIGILVAWTESSPQNVAFDACQARWATQISKGLGCGPGAVGQLPPVHTWGTVALPMPGQPPTDLKHASPPGSTPHACNSVRSLPARTSAPP